MVNIFSRIQQNLQQIMDVQTAPVCLRCKPWNYNNVALQLATCTNGSTVTFEEKHACAYALVICTDWLRNAFDALAAG